MLVSGRVAYRIAPLLEQAAADAIDDGARVEEGVAEAVRALKLAANAYAAGRVTAALGSSALPRDAAQRPSWHGWLTVAQVAERLGCKPRNVRDLRARARLAGEWDGSRWRFDPVVVAEFIEGRAAA